MQWAVPIGEGGELDLSFAGDLPVEIISQLHVKVQEHTELHDGLHIVVVSEFKITPFAGNHLSFTWVPLTKEKFRELNPHF
jgi:hypothetical protein